MAEGILKWNFFMCKTWSWKSTDTVKSSSSFELKDPEY